jgi:hypothetical protein
MRKATREEIVGEEAIEQTAALSEERFEWRARSSLLACQAPVVYVAQVYRLLLTITYDTGAHRGRAGAADVTHFSWHFDLQAGALSERLA